MKRCPKATKNSYMKHNHQTLINQYVEQQKPSRIYLTMKSGSFQDGGWKKPSSWSICKFIIYHHFFVNVNEFPL